MNIYSAHINSTLSLTWYLFVCFNAISFEQNVYNLFGSISFGYFTHSRFDILDLTLTLSQRWTHFHLIESVFFGVRMDFFFLQKKMEVLRLTTKFARLQMFLFFFFSFELMSAVCTFCIQQLLLLWL